MKIELKNVKIAQSLSEETLAFTATLYIDGAASYDVSNRGCGGCNNYYAKGKDVVGEKAIEAAIIASGAAKEGDFEILDCYLGDLLDAIEKKNILDRYLKSRITVITPKGLATYPTKFKPTAENLAKIAAQFTAKGSIDIIVNNNPAAYDRALALV